MHPHEQPQVIALWQACGLTRPWNDPAADIALSRGRPSSDILVARDNGEVIATVMVGEDGHRAWVYYLAVTPARRRQGIARAAMTAAEDWATQRGMPKMHLMVRLENTAVIAFYQSLGYEDGACVMMQKWLDANSAALYRESAKQGA